MFQSSTVINVYYINSDFDEDKFVNSFNLQDHNIDFRSAQKKSFESKNFSFFVFNNNYHKFTYDLFGASIKKKSIYFCHFSPSQGKKSFHPQSSTGDFIFDKNYDGPIFSGVKWGRSFQLDNKESSFLLGLERKNDKKGLFLDRDGILNIDNGYIGKLQDLEILDNLVEPIKKCNQNGIPVIVLTNQSGISRGFFKLEDVKKINAKISDHFGSLGAKIDDFYISPFHVDGKIPDYARESFYRKPFPGMALQAASDYGIDLKRSLMIGDKFSDCLYYVPLESKIVRSKYVNSEDEKRPIFSFEELLPILDRWIYL